MATTTRIEWTRGPDGRPGKTWGPVLGCDRVSAGCDGCYAINTIHRFGTSTPEFAGLTEHRDGRVDWTGKIRLLPERLDEPFRWRRPARVFVNSQSDLFHADVPDEFIARVFAVMAATPQHTYQILTKRPGRMRSLLNSGEFSMVQVSEEAIEGLGLDGIPWPLPNVHLGVSVENQHWANIRIPALLDTPAAVRWISAEPLLGPINLTRSGLRGIVNVVESSFDQDTGAEQRALDWVVAGGESGPKARPAHPDWFRALRDDCTAAGVPFFFKQWGSWGPVDTPAEWVAGARFVTRGGSFADRKLTGTQADLDDARQHGLQAMQRRSKTRNGHQLDGRDHLDHPTGDPR